MSGRGQVEASEAVRDEWLRRVEAEYRSSAITQQLTLWLTQIGASPDLIRDGLVIANDEMVHAEMSHAVYRSAGGTELPALDREQLGISRLASDLESDVLLAGVRYFCLGETVAVPLFSHLRHSCTQSDARAALDRILVDEVRHRDFGWALLEWLMDLGDAVRLRELAQAELPAMLRALERSYASSESYEMAESDRAWGLAPPGDYARILARTVEREYVPRFGAHGIDAGAAWAARS